jgi:hypothetical protein
VTADVAVLLHEQAWAADDLGSRSSLASFSESIRLWRDSTPSAVPDSAPATHGHAHQPDADDGEREPCRPPRPRIRTAVAAAVAVVAAQADVGRAVVIVVPADAAHPEQDDADDEAQHADVPEGRQRAQPATHRT